MVINIINQLQHNYITNIHLFISSFINISSVIAINTLLLDTFAGSISVFVYLNEL